jgi:hypothetical protein
MRQRLKPHSCCLFYGTAEAVPYKDLAVASRDAPRFAQGKKADNFFTFIYLLFGGPERKRHVVDGIVRQAGAFKLNGGVSYAEIGFQALADGQ